MDYISLRWNDLLVSLLLMAIPLAMSFQARLGIARDILIGTVRTFVQLTAIGYILTYLFHVQKWYWVVLMLVAMIVIAGYNGVKRQSTHVPGLFMIITGSIMLGALVAIGTLIVGILHVKPWWEPQYLIPISGMMIANAMNAAALAVDRLFSEASNRRWQVEAALALGASPLKAIQPSLREAARTAMMPTINSLMIVGIVQLPGMMTGQIIGGVAPAQSVRYQIVIMYMLTAAVTIACMATLYLTYRSLFNRDMQLQLDEFGM
ncbi:iron export ABC transporter permease subunit FetB [candidate division KSB1 bacterium]|nr:iron export ABC transporter permease subunit FetB [candidate division KSB1 bacterium]